MSVADTFWRSCYIQSESDIPLWNKRIVYVQYVESMLWYAMCGRVARHVSFWSIYVYLLFPRNGRVVMPVE